MRVVISRRTLAMILLTGSAIACIMFWLIGQVELIPAWINAQAGALLAVWLLGEAA